MLVGEVEYGLVFLLVGETAPAGLSVPLPPARAKKIRAVPKKKGAPCQSPCPPQGGRPAIISARRPSLADASFVRRFGRNKKDRLFV